MAADLPRAAKRAKRKQAAAAAPAAPAAAAAATAVAAARCHDEVEGERARFLQRSQLRAAVTCGGSGVASV